MAEGPEIILSRGENHKYKNIKQIDNGKNSFGQIHLVENLQDNKKYAIKILKTNVVKDKELFQREIGIFEELNKNENKYIPKLYDHGLGTIKRNGVLLSQRQYLVIDYFEKDNLKYYIEKTRNGFEERHAKIIYKRILKAIRYCHKNKICHLDIKPENILLDDNCKPKIIDFGLSDYFNESDGIPIYNKRGRGTIQYICPEMFKKDVPFSGVKADIYSLGEVLLNLVTNKYGFNIRKNKKSNETFWGAVQTNIGDKTLSDEFKTLYTWTTSKDPKQRPSSIDEILKHPWFKEINDLKKDNGDEYDELKNELVLKILEFEDDIKKDNEQIETKPKKEEKEDKPIKKSFSDNEELYFPLDMKPKKFDKDEFVNNFMKIKGYLNPAEFMNSFTKQMVEDFKDLDYYELYAKASKESLKLEAAFELEENCEIEEDAVDVLKGTNCVIKISLVKSGEDEYVIQFLRKEGEIGDYYELFLKIKEIIKKKLL